MSLRTCSLLTLGFVAAFVGSDRAAAADDVYVAARCPQPRATARAPDSYWSRVNPLPLTNDNLQRGRRLYQHDARPEACVDCHGESGDGAGHEAAGLDPPPRNFTCAATMTDIPDGQLYWIIENGSGEYHRPTRQEAQRIERPARGVPSSAMRAYGRRLTPTEIWQLVLYIRSLEHAES